MWSASSKRLTGEILRRFGFFRLDVTDRDFRLRWLNITPLGAAQYLLLPVAQLITIK